MESKYMNSSHMLQVLKMVLLVSVKKEKSVPCETEAIAACQMDLIFFLSHLEVC